MASVHPNNGNGSLSSQNSRSPKMDGILSATQQVEGGGASSRKRKLHDSTMCKGAERKARGRERHVRLLETASDRLMRQIGALLGGHPLSSKDRACGSVM